MSRWKKKKSYSHITKDLFFLYFIQRNEQISDLTMKTKVRTDRKKERRNILQLPERKEHITFRNIL